MQVSEILKLDLKQINNVACTNVIEDVYIGDLLSFVMANGTGRFVMVDCTKTS